METSLSLCVNDENFSFALSLIALVCEAEGFTLWKES
jgi:hypothetical protein